MLLTLAIVSHHFTAMGAVTLMPDPTLVADALTFSPACCRSCRRGRRLHSRHVVGRRRDRPPLKGKLHRQKVLLDTAIENMSQGLCMFDAEGRILLFNERYSEMMDRPGVPLQGRSLIDILRSEAAGKWDGDPEEFVAD